MALMLESRGALCETQKSIFACSPSEHLSPWGMSHQWLLVDLSDSRLRFNGKGREKTMLAAQYAVYPQANVNATSARGKTVVRQESEKREVPLDAGGYVKSGYWLMVLSTPKSPIALMLSVSLSMKNSGDFTNPMMVNIPPSRAVMHDTLT